MATPLRKSESPAGMIKEKSAFQVDRANKVGAVDLKQEPAGKYDFLERLYARKPASPKENKAEKPKATDIFSEHRGYIEADKFSRKILPQAHTKFFTESIERYRARQNPKQLFFRYFPDRKNKQDLKYLKRRELYLRMEKLKKEKAHPATLPSRRKEIEKQLKVLKDISAVPQSNQSLPNEQAQARKRTPSFLERLRNLGSPPSA